MDVINNYKSYLDALENGARKIYVTKEFYDWLRFNVKLDIIENEEGFMVDEYYNAKIYKED